VSIEIEQMSCYIIMMELYIYHWVDSNNLKSFKDRNKALLIFQVKDK
jgi:hypothetical protein